MTAPPFSSVFPQVAPIFAMLHLKGDSPADRFERAKREIDILWGGGVDAVIVENYYGTVDDVAAVCDHIDSTMPEVTFGVNVLGDDWRAFEIATEYGAMFVQLDSVAGHLPQEEDAEFGVRLALQRERSRALVLGGVRFKYQPYRSGQPLEVDLPSGASRADAIVVTGEGTGLQTPMEKILAFRELLGPDYPLVVGAGVNPESISEQLTHADAVVVGSYLKDTYQDTGDVDAAHVKEFMSAVRRLREKERAKA